MRLLALGLASIALSACATAAPTATTQSAELTLPSTPSLAGWSGRFVAARDPNDFTTRLRSLEIEVDPVRPEDGGQYAYYYRHGFYREGTFRWSKAPTALRAELVFSTGFEVSLERSRPSDSGFTTSGLDWYEGPFGEAVDTVVAPLHDDVCDHSTCATDETCQDAAFDPDGKVVSHACVANGTEVVAWDLPDPVVTR